MLMSPQPPSQFISGVGSGSALKTFLRLRDVTGDVACLDFGRKSYVYRGIIKVNTVNFAFMSEEDQNALIEGFKEFLNGLSFPIQILVRNLPYQLNKYLADMESVEGDLAEMAHDHANFVRELASKRALVKRSFYIIVPADKTLTRNRTESLIQAQTQIKLRIDELLRQLERIGLTGTRLKDREIVRLYQSCFLSEEARQFPVSDGLIDSANRMMASARDKTKYDENFYKIELEEDRIEEQTKALQLIQSTQQESKHKADKLDKDPIFGNLPETIAPSSIQVYPWYMRIDGEMEQEFVRSLAMVNYPRSAYPGWLDSIIQVDEPNVDFSIHITPLNPQQVNQRLGKKSVEFRGSVLASHRQGKMPDPTTTVALQDIEKMRDKLVRGDERIFNIAVIIQVRGRTRQELSERNNRILAAIRSLDFRALPAHWQHHAGFLSCLPDADNQLGRGRLFSTGSAATFYPFTGSDLSMETGVLFGIHSGGSLIILDPFNSNELENANLVVFAKSGAGKSFFLKTIASRLLPTCNVYVVDPEAEYNVMCERVNGQYVRLSPDSLQLNPLELYAQHSFSPSESDAQMDEENFFREKLLNLISLFEILLSDNGSLTQKEQAFLFRCLVKTYENRGITIDPATHGRPAPNMKEFYMVMSSSLRGDNRFGVSPDTYGLSERLERYLHLFPNKTRVELNNKLIDFNIRELNDKLKPIGLFLITDFLWTKMRQARQANTRQPHSIILIDEAWLLMQFPQGAKFLAEFARRIRKYGGGLWCTTQNSDDFLNSEEGRTILAMATMKFLMKQDSTTIDSVIRTFHLSTEQRNFLLSARRGEGLFSTKGWTDMQVVASPKEAEMANTTVGGLASQTVYLDKEQLLQIEGPGQSEEVLADDSLELSAEDAVDKYLLASKKRKDEESARGNHRN